MKQNKTANVELPEPIFFDGYCPESILKGEKVVMLLNEDDFFESPTTGLQMTCFPPYATILKWRGKGKFKFHRYEAPDYYRGLIFAKASNERNREIYPDQNEILTDSFELKQYLQTVSPSYEEYEKKHFDKEAELFKKQQEHLQSIATEEWENLIELYKIVEKEGLDGEAFSQFHEMLYDLEIIFDFDWKNSGCARKLFADECLNFSDCDLFQLSVYLTIIFRSGRFNDVSTITAFDNRILDKLIARVKEIT